ncbi:M20 aminoacylase family protein [Denitromonas iodatirespirans]|uniref:Amidohydrolase n=1 Tax=Denitromonas iodatirespirans TaxID=2795389 RepID=A0A944D7B2_DENI1|nr:M20 aminoacylase family protein [Denitromonas iodatirespirans]MBT0961365.1 amidohydrolase [Denitromonas iodatirespirans]
MKIIDAVKQQHAALTTFRRDIHAHPELAFDEHRTAKLVADRLEAAGIETHRGIGRTGVVGVIRAGSSQRAIGLRADMDALPIQERNTFPHHSKHPGRMHACGHDGHTTMLLGAAEHLAKHPDFDGTVVFIFQPAEEGDGGGREMVEDGLFERFPMDAVFGLHNWPGLPAGNIAVHDGPVMASADRFDIEVLGHGAHAAMPHLGVDPVIAASALVQALQTVVSRTLNPLDPAVLSVTQVHAGEAHNVIPDRARITGTVRAFSTEVQAQIEATMQRICQGIGTAYNVNVRFNFLRGYPATINTSAEAAQCAEVARALVGEAAVRTDLKPSMGAEDFAYFLHEKPGCYVWLGNGPGEGGCMLHNPNYDFNDQVIPVGVSYWVRLVEHLLAR